MKEIFLKYLIQLIEFYKGMFISDIEVFSQPWIYICLLIPAFFYLMFFILKWTILTAPFWIPIRIIARAIRGSGRN